MEYMHPGYRNMYPITTVLRDLASQEGCDGEPYDVMIAAADHIARLTAERDEAILPAQPHTEASPDLQALRDTLKNLAHAPELGRSLHTLLKEKILLARAALQTHFPEEPKPQPQEALPAWQPIASAPKDGTSILAIIPGYEPDVVRWSEIEGVMGWGPDASVFDCDDELKQYLLANRYEPLYWMAIQPLIDMLPVETPPPSIWDEDGDSDG